MSRILLTGGTGFLGSHVAELLVEAGHDVRATVRSSSDTRWLDPLPLLTVVADLSDPGDLETIASGVETVVHVGGVTIAADPAVYDRVNAEGTRVLAEAAVRAGVERFVYVSSLAARGPDGASGPESPYGLSKRRGEDALAEEAAGAGAPGAFRTVVLRPGGIYGPRDADMLTLFRMADRGWLVLPAGEGRLQPVHVADVAAAVVAAIDAPAEAGRAPLPVMGPEVLGWRDVAAALSAAVGRRVRTLRVPGGVYYAAGAVAEGLARVTGAVPAFDRRRATDLTSRAFTSGIADTQRALEWKPRYDIRRGMADTVEWYRAQGWMRGAGDE